MESIKIAIAEDNEIIRNILLNNFEQQEKIQVVIAAENGKILLDNLYKTDVDVVLLDVNMPIMNGYETMCRLHILFPEIKVILYSSEITAMIIDYFEKLGVGKFLLKESDINLIVEAICEVYDVIPKKTIQIAS